MSPMNSESVPIPADYARYVQPRSPQLAPPAFRSADEVPECFRVKEQLYAMWGVFASGWITHRGLIVVHPSREEMEFLLAGTFECKPLPRDIPSTDIIYLRELPGVKGVIEFPLNRKDFATMRDSTRSRSPRHG
jgi:hypothetical protein